MAASGDTSKARINRNRAADLALFEIIEAERNRLMKAESVLHCALIAMDYDDDEMHGPYYPNIIEIARELLNKSIDQLDSLRLRPMIEAKGDVPYPISEEKMTAGLQGKEAVKDSAHVIYLS